MTSTDGARIPIPRGDGETVVAPPGSGPGFWAGGPSAVATADGIYLAYRLRRPVDAGRGYAMVVARSDDGLAFTPLVTLDEGSVRDRVVRAPGARRPPRRRLASLCELLDPEQQALVGGCDRRRHAERVHTPTAA